MRDFSDINNDGIFRMFNIPASVATIKISNF